LSELSKGNICPCCGIGKLYRGQERKLLSFKGSAPIGVERYIKETLRCNACSKEYTAESNIPKWDKTARSSAVLQKCNGMPFYRLSKLQSLYNVPIAEATLWMLCKDLWEIAGKQIYQELIECAKHCKNYYVDDTRARVLEIITKNKKLQEQGLKKGKSCYSTILNTETEESHKIVLYITKRSVAGENIKEIMSGGRKNIMSDASSMNKPNLEEEELKMIVSFNCLTHGYRKFKEIADYYPKECKYFSKQLLAIYDIDYNTKKEKMNDAERLKYHQTHSKKYIENIYREISRLFGEKLIEPNSHLGQAMKYWQNNKDGLTRFLYVAGIELDNNKSERGLKIIILQRKNSLFFRSLASATVLSGLTSIIATCQENNINSFNYLTWLQDNERLVRKNPSEYLPWKYQEYINETEPITQAA
jgi:hypothetical protein